MEERASEVVIANLLFIAFWVSTVVIILIAGRRGRLQSFRSKMVDQWRPALVIAGLFVVSMVLAGEGILNPYALAVFCQALLGLALARGIQNYEPLPVTRAFARRERILRSVGLMLLIALLLVPVALAIGSVGLSIAQQIFGEVSHTQEAMGTLPQNDLQVFFALLAGAGIAEETIYRLVLLSLLWRWTRRRWLSIILSALVFAAYHLTPLNGMYRTFLQFPASQFLASALIGIVWGYIYVKRGYETAVLAHTFSDWIPFLVFA
ncbi:MAG: type II CAAX endopeptidase family protein [Anaerolineae bacterium]